MLSRPKEGGGYDTSVFCPLRIFMAAFDGCIYHIVGQVQVMLSEELFILV